MTFTCMAVSNEIAITWARDCLKEQHYVLTRANLRRNTIKVPCASMAKTRFTFSYKIFSFVYMSVLCVKIGRYSAGGVSVSPFKGVIERPRMQLSVS